MKLYQLGKGVCNYYRKNVKGNETLSHEMVQKKLTRNIKLAIRIPIEEDNVLYLYGKLHIFMKGNVITKIVNRKMKGGWFYKDRKKYKELNELLGIKSKVEWKEEGSMDYVDEYAKGFVKV